MTSTYGTNLLKDHSGPGVALPRFAVVALFLLVLTGLVLAATLGTRPENSDKSQTSIARLSTTQALLGETSGRQAEILSRGETAERRNALIPISRVPMDAPSAFLSIPLGTPAYETALKCLTQAVYYEAANEPLDGKRAVAQVVLNRVRHPAYPDSVCGVVYQGSNDDVCQFSFTCDGSLLRGRLQPQWSEAKTVAAAALDGFVERSVGSATHYHADYVVPRWAYTLGKIEQLGHHIFYRFDGSAGDTSFLTAHWSGSEKIPELDYDRLRSQLAASDTPPVAAETKVPGLTVTPLVTDRHAESDVGGRIDMTKTWRPSIPDPVEASRSYVRAIADQRKVEPIALGSDIRVP